MKRLRTLALAGFVIAAAVAMVLFAPRILGAFQPQASTSIQTITLKTESFERTIPAEGYLKAEQATPITPPPGRGRLKIAWIKDNGSTVKKGEVVVRFDRSEFERNLENGESDKKVANAQLGSERIQSSNARANRERTADLAKMDLEVTRARAEEGTEDIYSRNEILTSQIDGKLSEARVQHSTATDRIDRSITRKKLQLLELQKKAAEIKITQANSGLERMEVTAPHDGIFVYERAELKAGDQVYPGRPLAKLPLVDTMEAEVFVLEADAMGLEAGVPASLVLESQGGTRFAASIKKVDALAKRRQREVPTQYFAVTLSIEKTDTAVMKPGQRIRSTLKLESVEALVVPRQCIFDVDGELVAYKKVGSGFEVVKVKLGPGTPGRVVVEEGLASGDVVATQDPFKVGKESQDEEDDKGSSEGEGGQ
jgi:multidrug efflux pump subunit AcrA (membrane-fusion protein)